MKKVNLILSILFITVPILKIFSQTVDVSITNLASSDGQIVMGIYQDQKTWTAETPLRTEYIYKGSNVSSSVLKLTLNLEPGTYGLGILDDENFDKKMNYTWIGWPLEGFGFSNIYHTQMSKPKFDSFKFSLSKGQHISVTIKVKYM